MNANLKLTISKEDRFNVQDLVYEINAGTESTFDLHPLHGNEGFSLDAFADFERLTEKAKHRLIEKLAVSMPEADAVLTFNQIEQFEFFGEDIERED